MDVATKEQLIAFVESSSLFPNVDKSTWNVEKNRIEEGIRFAWKGSRKTDTDPIVNQYPLAVPARKSGDREKLDYNVTFTPYLNVEEPPSAPILALFAKLLDHQESKFPFLTWKEYSTMYLYLKKIIPDTLADYPAFETASSEQLKNNEVILVILTTFWKARGYYGTINYLLKKPLWAPIERDLWKLIIGDNAIGTQEEMILLYIRIIKNFLPPAIDYPIPSNSTFWDMMNVYVAADKWDHTHSPTDTDYPKPILQILTGSLQFVKNTRVRLLDLINAVNVWYPTRYAQAQQLYTCNWQVLLTKHYVHQWLNLVGSSLLIKKGNLYDYELLAKNWTGSSIKPPPVNFMQWRVNPNYDLGNARNFYPPPRGQELLLMKRITQDAIVNPNVIFSETDLVVIAAYYKKIERVYQFDINKALNDHVYQQEQLKEIDLFINYFYVFALFVKHASQDFTLDPSIWEWKDPATEAGFTVPDGFYKPPAFPYKGKSKAFVKLVNELELLWVDNGGWTLWGKANDGYHIDPALYKDLEPGEQAFFTFCNQYPITPIRKQGFWNALKNLNDDNKAKYFTTLKIQFRCYIVWVNDNIIAQAACKNNAALYTKPGDVFQLEGKEYSEGGEKVRNAVINIGILEDPGKDTPPWYAYTGVGAAWSLLGDFLFGADYWKFIRDGVVKLFEKALELLRETVRLALNIAKTIWDETAKWLGFSPWWLVAAGGVILGAKVGVDVLEDRLNRPQRERQYEIQ